MMPSVTMIFSIEIMSTSQEIKYHFKQSYHKHQSYPYPTPNLSYPLFYPTLPYPLPYRTLPPTLPLTYPTPYSTPNLSYPLDLTTLPHPTPTLPLPYPTLPYPTLNRSVNLPIMYLSHVRYSLMSVSVFSCVIFGLFWICIYLFQTDLFHLKFMISAIWFWYSKFSIFGWWRSPFYLLRGLYFSTYSVC